MTPDNCGVLSCYPESRIFVRLRALYGDMTGPFFSSGRSARAESWLKQLGDQVSHGHQQAVSREYPHLGLNTPLFGISHT